MKKLFSSLLVGMLLTGCGITQHLTHNQNITQTEILLTSNNYRIVTTVEGTAEATHIFGIGGLSRRALKENAYADMVKNAKLHGSQAIININTTEKRQCILIYTHRKVITRGTVIEFLNPTAAPLSDPLAQSSTPTESGATAHTSTSAVQQTCTTSQSFLHYKTTDNQELALLTKLYPEVLENRYDEQGLITLSGTAIPNRLFHEQSDLRQIVLSPGITLIGDSAFTRCTQLTTVTLSENTASIGFQAFKDCFQLTHLYCPATIPPALAQTAFESCNKELTIFVPKASVEKYISAKGWRAYKKQIVGL